MTPKLSFEIEKTLNGFVWRALVDGDQVMSGTESSQKGVQRSIGRVRLNYENGRGIHGR